MDIFKNKKNTLELPKIKSYSALSTFVFQLSIYIFKLENIFLELII